LPSAELLNEVANKARRANHQDAPVLIYDDIGIGDGWAAHLKWLDENIQCVKAIKVSWAGWVLAGY
jgi:hypothetical protein